MHAKPSIYWKTTLLLPFILGACGGNPHSVSHTVAESQVNTPANSVPASPVTGQDSETQEEKNAAQTTGKDGQSVQTTQNNSTSAAVSVPDIHTPTRPVPDSKTSETTTDTPTQPDDDTDALAKTPVTPELIEKVKQAKTATDSPGLPHDYRADYVVITPTGRTQLTLQAKDDSTEPYHFNSSVFPQGESLGTMRSQLGDKPHTEEDFMSYQQFYSGITGSRKNVVYFDDEAVQRDEPFYIDLPTGLVSQESDLPTAGEAHYLGKAIDGNRFGDFSYRVNFKEKTGLGGTIVWDKTKAGNIGDIVLEPGKIAAQVLSVAADPDLFPDEYSHRGPGITGIAAIAGEDKKFAYKGVFFGPRAEEFSGLIYENDPAAHGHGISDDIEQKNIVSFAGAR